MRPLQEWTIGREQHPGGSVDIRNGDGKLVIGSF